MVHESEAIVMDLDDFCDIFFPQLQVLDRLYAESEGRLKCTLFAVPAACSDEVLYAVAGRPWLEMAVHGWDHRPHECRDWTREETVQALASALRRGTQHGEDDSYFTALFKPPFWEASADCYEVLAERNWAVADHPRNSYRLPGHLRRYVLGADHSLGVAHPLLPIIQAHGHCPNVEGNGLMQRYGDFLEMARSGRPYKFVSEVVQ